jgi:heme/copper-type cytochrome/quinol oxidase subunit 2
MAVIILRVILVLLPFALYFIWLRYTRKRAEAKDAEDDEAVARAEKEIMIAVGGLVLVVIFSVFSLRLQENKADPSKAYIPPHTENGQVVPGHFK